MSVEPGPTCSAEPLDPGLMRCDMPYPHSLLPHHFAPQVVSVAEVVRDERDPSETGGWFNQDLPGAARLWQALNAFHQRHPELDGITITATRRTEEA